MRSTRRVGYNNAARLVERMEKDGYVGVPDHVGRREACIGDDGGARRGGKVEAGGGNERLGAGARRARSSRRGCIRCPPEQPCEARQVAPLDTRPPRQQRNRQHPKRCSERSGQRDPAERRQCGECLVGEQSDASARAGRQRRRIAKRPEAGREQRRATE